MSQYTWILYRTDDGNYDVCSRKDLKEIKAANPGCTFTQVKEVHGNKKTMKKLCEESFRLNGIV